jgi:hypothetical protein
MPKRQGPTDVHRRAMLPPPPAAPALLLLSASCLVCAAAEKRHPTERKGAADRQRLQTTSAQRSISIAACGCICGWQAAAASRLRLARQA